MYHLSPLACLTGFYVLLGVGGLAHPPAEVLRRVAIPILIIHSGRDTSVSPQAAAQLFVQVDKPLRVWRSYPDLDHGMNQPDGRLAMPQVLVDMAQWLSQAGQRTP